MRVNLITKIILIIINGALILGCVSIYGARHASTKSLLGVDLNGNEIQDDVDQQIELLYPTDSSEKQVAYKYAHELQEIIFDPTQKLTHLYQLDKHVHPLYYNCLDINKAMEIFKSSFDTSARKFRYHQSRVPAPRNIYLFKEHDAACNILITNRTPAYQAPKSVMTDINTAFVQQGFSPAPKDTYDVFLGDSTITKNNGSVTEKLNVQTFIKTSVWWKVNDQLAIHAPASTAIGFDVPLPSTNSTVVSITADNLEIAKIAETVRKYMTENRYDFQPEQSGTFGQEFSSAIYTDAYLDPITQLRCRLEITGIGTAEDISSPQQLSVTFACVDTYTYQNYYDRHAPFFEVVNDRLKSSPPDLYLLAPNYFKKCQNDQNIKPIRINSLTEDEIRFVYAKKVNNTWENSGLTRPEAEQLCGTID
jgi:hypothetical protein